MWLFQLKTVCAPTVSRQPLWGLWWCCNRIMMFSPEHLSCHGVDLSDFLPVFFWLSHRTWCWSWCLVTVAMTAAITCTTWTRGQTSSTTRPQLASCSTWRPVSRRQSRRHTDCVTECYLKSKHNIYVHYFTLYLYVVCLLCVCVWDGCVFSQPAKVSM